MTDLLATAIEVISVGASGRQLRQPIKIPRPKPNKSTARTTSPEERDRAFKRGIGVLASTARGVGNR